MKVDPVSNVIASMINTENGSVSVSAATIHNAWGKELSEENEVNPIKITTSDDDKEINVKINLRK